MPSRPFPIPNPFYVFLLLVSTAFVISALAYLVSPTVYQQSLDGTRDSAPALALWLDDWGPWLMTIEVVLMMLSGTLAMVTDHWFHPKAAPARR